MGDGRDCRRLAQLSYAEVKTLVEGGCVAFLPTGATEAHGPHLPLATDVVISEHSALKAVSTLQERGVSSIVLPPIAYAVTEFAAPFSGTISIPLTTSTALVRDVILGAIRTGFLGVVVCNAHLEPGNIRALSDAVKACQEQGVRARFVDVTRKPHALRLGEEFKSGACHAGQYETSLVMAATPSWVQTAVAETLEDNPSSLSVAIRAGKTNFLEAGGPNAYFGYPSQATVGEGELLYETLGDIFATAAQELLAEAG